LKLTVPPYAEYRLVAGIGRSANLTDQFGLTRHLLAGNDEDFIARLNPGVGQDAALLNAVDTQAVVSHTAYYAEHIP